MTHYIDENGEVRPGHFIRTPYNYDTDVVSEQTGTECPEETLAQQQFKDDADINYMMERFGVIDNVPKVTNMPTSGDFTQNVTDYQTALNIMVWAKQEFMKQPADLRSRFNNDPQLFMNFMENPDNQDEAIKLGLATRRPDPKPDAADRIIAAMEKNKEKEN